MQCPTEPHNVENQWLIYEQYHVQSLIPRHSLAFANLVRWRKVPQSNTARPENHVRTAVDRTQERESAVCGDTEVALIR